MTVLTDTNDILTMYELSNKLNYLLKEGQKFFEADTTMGNEVDFDDVFEQRIYYFNFSQKELGDIEKHTGFATPGNSRSESETESDGYNPTHKFEGLKEPIFLNGIIGNDFFKTNYMAFVFQRDISYINESGEEITEKLNIFINKYPQAMHLVEFFYAQRDKFDVSNYSYVQNKVETLTMKKVKKYTDFSHSGEPTDSDVLYDNIALYYMSDTAYYNFYADSEIVLNFNKQVCLNAIKFFSITTQNIDFELYYQIFQNF